MTNFKPQSKVVLEELLSDQITPPPTTVVGEESKETIVPHQGTITTRCSGRVIMLEIKSEKNAAEAFRLVV